MRINVVYAARDPNRAGSLMEAVARSGFTVTTAQRSKEVLGLLGQRSCDVLIIGAQLADEEGLRLVNVLRGKGPTRQLPIIALLEHDANAAPPPIAGFATATGHIRRDHNAPPAPPPPGGRVSLRLAFFQAGADECLMLNQDMAESIARIKAVLRRTMTNPAEEIIKTGPVELNLTSYTLHVSGKAVPLTSKELDLLYVLLSSPNRVLSRPYLIERVWGYNYFGSPRTVDVHVRRLREKLGKAAKLIHTIPCVGYKMIPPGSEMTR